MQFIKLEDGQQKINVEVIAANPIAWTDLNGLPRLIGTIRTLHAMSPVSSVIFGENRAPLFPGPPGPSGTHRLLVSLVDGRSADFVFYDVTLASYTTTVGIAPWAEGLALQLVEVSRAIQSLHAQFLLNKFEWNVKP